MLVLRIAITTKTLGPFTRAIFRISLRFEGWKGVNQLQIFQCLRSHNNLTEYSAPSHRLKEENHTLNRECKWTYCQMVEIHFR